MRPARQIRCRRSHGPGSDADGARSRRLDDLLARVADRDRAAFRELYTLTAAKHFGIALHILRDRDSAEEVMQDVAHAIWRNAGRYDPSHGRPAAWMNAIARNQAIDRLRRERTRPAASGTPADDLAADGSHRVEERLALDGMLAEIRPDYRRALLLSYFAGYSHAELAEVLGVPLGTAKSWLRRGLSELAARNGPPPSLGPAGRGSA